MLRGRSIRGHSVWDSDNENNSEQAKYLRIERSGLVDGLVLVGGAVNPATRHVHDLRTASPVHAFVADHGEGVASNKIEHETVAGREISLSADVTAEERSLIRDEIHATGPTDTACFANALRLWKHNPRFKYVEGFAVMDDLSGEVEHAWSMLDGEKLVDSTTPFDHYHGVVIEDRDTLQRYAESEPRHGIIGNHKNRFKFLRERGYYE